MKIIISLSGGMDSATLLGLAKHEGHEVVGVGFCYGSKHNRYENRAAQDLATFYEIPYRLIDFTSIAQGFRSNLMLNGGPIPEGHYEEKSMEQTVVPARNIIFASILAGVSWSIDAQEVWLGIHAGDHAIYPDCRPDFYFSMNAAMQRGTGERVRLHAPFLYIDKAQILKRGLELGVPYELTRTCYKQQEVACGVCGSCQERLEAFDKNDRVDPLEYESRDLLPKKGE